MSRGRLEDVLSTPWKRLEDVLKTFSQDVLKTYNQDEYIARDEDVLRTSWKRLLKTYEQGEYIRLDQDALKTSSSRRMFAGMLRAKFSVTSKYLKIVK